MSKFSLIDSHCHLDFKVFDDDRADVLARARENNITDIIIPGVSTQNWPDIQMLCDRNKNLHPCYGLHPYWANQHNENDLEKLKQQVVTNRCVAIGECGLDYRPEQTDKKIQLHFFETQLDIALENNLPVVIHSVRATEDIIKQLRARPGLRGMVHSYSGSYEQAMQLIETGFLISLGGAITYERAHKLHHLAGQLPLSSLLIETDAPDQPDASHKSERNEPAYLVEIFDVLCKLRKEEKEEIAQQTSLNAKALFNIN
ncbi:MAG: TatD family hydrolase [Gammaproteobacteria bacterium]|nr:TatD family hydrolase [Gammaproteobacteria bacterium]